TTSTSLTTIRRDYPVSRLRGWTTCTFTHSSRGACAVVSRCTGKAGSSGMAARTLAHLLEVRVQTGVAPCVRFRLFPRLERAMLALAGAVEPALLPLIEAALGPRMRAWFGIGMAHALPVQQRRRQCSDRSALGP